jgi:hypothetical protein
MEKNYCYVCKVGFARGTTLRIHYLSEKHLQKVADVETEDGDKPLLTLVKELKRRVDELEQEVEINDKVKSDWMREICARLDKGGL